MSELSLFPYSSRSVLSLLRRRSLFSKATSLSLELVGFFFGGFLTPRFLNMEAMARTFKQLWRSTNGFKIQNHKEQRVLFVFDNLGDVYRILQNQPWSFDKHLVMLQRYNSDVPICDLIFKTTLFWVQVHNILVRYMNR